MSDDKDGQMTGQLFITQGDITRLCADAIAVTGGKAFGKPTQNFAHLNDLAGGDLPAALLQAQTAKPEGPVWLPFAGKSPKGPQGMVFVPLVMSYQSPEIHAARVMVTQAVDTAVASLRRAADPDGADAVGTPGRFLIALIGFRMSKGGDASDRFVSARQQVEAAYDALQRYPDIDLAFVLEDRAKYEIFLTARRRFQQESGRTTPLLPELAYTADLIDAFKDGECVVFVGAGFSTNSGVKGYRALIQHMADDLGMKEDVGLDQNTYLDIAQLFRTVRGNDAVENLIAQHFGDACGALPSLAHYLLMSLPVRFVVTTNYDHLLEQTLGALHRYPLRVVKPEEVARTGYRDGTYVVKFHGDAHEGGAVLSRDDYDGFFHNHPEMASLLEGLLLNQTFFFVGYSLQDPNFRHIYGKIGLMLRNACRPAFVATFDRTNPVLRDHLRKRQLHLLELMEPAPGDAVMPPPALNRERGRRLMRFLDQFSESVSEGRRLFLTRDSPNDSFPFDNATARASTVSGRLSASVATSPLRDVQSALDETGRHLATAILTSESLTLGDIRTAARILSLLADMGWRPRPSQSGRSRAVSGQAINLQNLWLRLTEHLPEEPTSRRERRELLLSALRYSEGIAAAHHVREKLEHLDREDTRENGVDHALVIS